MERANESTFETRFRKVAHLVLCSTYNKIPGPDYIGRALECSFPWEPGEPLYENENSCVVVRLPHGTGRVGFSR